MQFSLDRAIAREESKAIPAHPALMDRSTPISTYAPGASRQDAKLSQQSAPRHTSAYGGDQAIDWVYDCIGLYSDPASTAPYYLTQDDGTKLVKHKTKGTPPEYEVGPPELYRLLEKPNPYMLYDELMSLLVIDLMLVGNAYWFKWRATEDGKPLALYRLAPSHVKIIPGDFGPKRYEYQPPGARNPLKIDLDKMIHFRRPNPVDAFYGMGIIQGGGRAFDMELAITDTITSYYENRADPSLIVQSERRVPRDVFNKLRAQLRSRVAGSAKAGELLVLESGLKASSLDRSARDSLFADLSKMSRDRCFTKFRASPMLFGLMDESAGSNKVSDARREFDYSALNPFLKRLGFNISASLTAAWGLNFVIDHKSALPAEEAIKVGESVAKLPGVKVREVRKQYAQFGIEESTGDPEIDEEILNMPGEELGPDGQPVNGGEGFADRPLAGEAGRPPKGENTRTFPKSGAARAGSRTRTASGKALRSLEELSEELEREARIEARMNPEGKAGPVSTPAADNRLPGEERPQDNFAGARRIDIDGSRDFMVVGLADAATQLERDLLDHVEGKALKSSDLVGRIRKSAAWTTFRESVEQVLLEGARRAASSGVMHSGLEPEDEIDYDAIAAEVVHRPEGLRSIVKTIRDRVVNRVKEARDKDAERHEFEAVVRAATTEWAADWAPGIADSEATEAYNEGTLTAGEASGITDFFVVEEDDAPDQPCQDAKDSVWPLDKCRENRKEHPRCRRAFLPMQAVA